MSDFVVHGIPGSPYTRSALLGLIEKGVPYRFAPMAMGEHRSAEHLRRNPFGRIPVVEHDGFMLYETQAILRYVDALFSEPALQSSEAKAAARMDQIIGIVDWYVMPTITAVIGWQRIVVPMLGQTPDEAAITAAIPGARVCIQELVRLKGTSTFLVGDRITLADLMLAPQLDFFAATPEGQEMLEGTSLTGWLDLLRERESMRATTWERLKPAA